MKRVKIYLRSVLQEKEEKLSLFDSNGDGGINELVTIVSAGDLVIWKPDCRNGIKEITRIYSKTGEGNIFHCEPKKSLFGKFKLRIPRDAKGEEAYGIDYVSCEGKKIKVDPVLKVKPPPEE